MLVRAFKNWKTTLIGIIGLIVTILISIGKLPAGSQSDIMDILTGIVTNAESIYTAIAAIILMFGAHDPKKPLKAGPGGIQKG